MPETSINRVVRGAAYLDQKSPGWERKIDLSILDIQDCQNCICGQSIGWSVAVLDLFQYSSSDDYIAAMGQHESISAYYGFILQEDGDAWADLIKERFNSGALSDMA